MNSKFDLIVVFSEYYAKSAKDDSYTGKAPFSGKYEIYNDSYGGNNVSVRREDYGGSWMQVDPSIKKWKDWFDYNPIGKLFRWLPGELMNGMLDDRYLRPKTVSMYRLDTFLWCSNPYGGTDNLWRHSRKSPDYVVENIGIGYTLPYYLLKYYGYLDSL